MTNLKTHDRLGLLLFLYIVAFLGVLYRSGERHFTEIEAICSAHGMTWKDLSKVYVCIDKTGRIYDPDSLP